MKLFRTGATVWILCLLVAGALVTAEVARGAERGWHGETMPQGLERGEAEGEYRWPRDGSIMVYIPSGPFLMGSSDEDAEADERPQREVVLDGFYIDKYEVSWRQWKASALPYSTITGTRRARPEPPDWGVLDAHPMVNVTWREAQAFMAWAGKRLPTEAEWEKAARGTDGRTYPWGNDPPTFDRAIWHDHPQSSMSTAEVVCCEAGASPYGVMNMAGNVYEWCEDVYDRAYYKRAPARNPVNLAEGRHRVMRGGAFTLELEDLRSALRYRLLPVDRGPYIGFRAALSAVPQDEAETEAP